MKIRTLISEWEHGSRLIYQECLSQAEVKRVSVKETIDYHKYIARGLVVPSGKEYKIETQVSMDGNWFTVYMTWASDMEVRK